MTLPVLLLLAALQPAPQDPPATTPPAAESEAQPAEDQAAPAAATTPSRSSSAAMDTGDPVASGLEAYRRRRFKQAESHFRRAVEQDPQSAAAHYYLGYTIYKIAEPRRPRSPGKAEAAQHFAKAYELDPAFKPAWGPRT